MKNKNISNLAEVRLAKRLRRDVPEIKKIVDNFINLCEPYLDYIDVAKAARQAEESIIMLETIELVYRNYLPRRDKQ